MEFASLTVSGILAASFLALGAIGLTLTFGIARFANIAHTDYMTLGAWIGDQGLAMQFMAAAEVAELGTVISGPIFMPN